MYVLTTSNLSPHRVEDRKQTKQDIPANTNKYITVLHQSSKQNKDW